VSAPEPRPLAAPAAGSSQPDVRPPDWPSARSSGPGEESWLGTGCFAVIFKEIVAVFKESGHCCCMCCPFGCPSASRASHQHLQPGLHFAQGWFCRGCAGCHDAEMTPRGASQPHCRFCAAASPRAPRAGREGEGEAWWDLVPSNCG